MKVQEYIGLLSWTAADKLLYVMYGIVSVVQLTAVTPEVFAVFQIMLGFLSFFYSFGDSVALSLIIQFGTLPEGRPKANLMGLLLFGLSAVVPATALFILNDEFAMLLSEPALAEIGPMLLILTIISIPRLIVVKMAYRDHEMNKLFWMNFCYFGTLTVYTFILLSRVQWFTFADLARMYVLSNIISSAAGFLMKRKDFRFSLHGGDSLKEMILFSLPNTVNNFLHSIPKTMDVTILKYFFSTELVGIYSAARQLFRVFDEAINAVTPLLYSAYLKLRYSADKKALNDLATKSTSFLLLGFSLAILVAYSGLSSWAIITFLPPRFAPAADYFNMLLLSGLFMPFITIFSAIVAFGRMKKANSIIFISVIGYVAAVAAIGNLGLTALMPLSLVIYYLILGALCYADACKSFDYKPSQILRSLPDSIGFVRSFAAKHFAK